MSSVKGGESAWHKIDRFSEEFEKSQEKQSIKDKPLISCGILEFFQTTAGFKPTAYQEKLLVDDNQFIVARWCRQSGKSLSLSILCLYTALSEPNRRVVVLGPILPPVASTRP
ncbi:MAG TPA: hypothetical protein VFE98_04100 [Candidatus Bathyarchaeia archaeon]|nr:hypothetical protein [Candidatus Bathyarchaeia archaeon]